MVSDPARGDRRWLVHLYTAAARVLAFLAARDIFQYRYPRARSSGCAVDRGRRDRRALARLAQVFGRGARR
jgi:hypothetical protein